MGRQLGFSPECYVDCGVLNLPHLTEVSANLPIGAPWGTPGAQRWAGKDRGGSRNPWQPSTLPHAKARASLPCHVFPSAYRQAWGAKPGAFPWTPDAASQGAPAKVPPPLSARYDPLCPWAPPTMRAPHTAERKHLTHGL